MGGDEDIKNIGIEMVREYLPKLHLRPPIRAFEDLDLFSSSEEAVRSVTAEGSFSRMLFYEERMEGKEFGNRIQ
jgi:hypothetical protein